MSGWNRFESYDSCTVRDGRSQARPRLVGRALLAVLIGMLAGGGLNAVVGEQGADTPALALLGGVLALAVVIVQTRRLARKPPEV